jgi:threonylcarbamoyladenosine tRNA methylthiotransferase MtaB
MVVVNGCGVTAQAMAEARSAIRRARRQNPGARIIATGCSAQIDPAMFANMAEVDRVVGNAEKLDPSSYRFAENNDATGPGDPAQPRVMVADIMALTRTAPQFIPAFSSHARAFLEVQNGCDHRCTFCVIPYGRGPSRSVSVEGVIAAARQLVNNGHREIVLTGVDLTSYGHDLPGTPRLATLIQRLLHAVPALERLRLGSIDVAEMDDPLVDLLTGEPRMMPHVHLSLQHGDDLMLKRMKRRHSRAQALAMVERLHHKRPEIAIGADLIAGFPTEDDDAARANESLISDAQIRFAHVFPYSPRAGTPAARMPQLERSEIKARAARLRSVGDTARTAWLNRKIGTTATMLVERDGYSGHIDDFARIRLRQPVVPGTVTPVRITGLDEHGLIGEGAA